MMTRFSLSSRVLPGLFLSIIFIVSVLFFGFRGLEEKPLEPSPTIEELIADPHSADIPLSGIYSERPADSRFCAERFGTAYLRNLSQSAANYCKPTSRSRLTCFHTAIDAKGRVDSFCVGGPSAVDYTDRHFELACNLSDQTEPPLARFPAYWYETGPSHILSKYVKIGRGENIPHFVPPARPRYAILVKRETGNYNLWHSLMEILSLFMTIDVLQITRDPIRNQPFFKPGDIDKAQLVILDDLHDGPFFEIWSLFSAKPPARLDPSSSKIPPLDFTDIIVPLPGGSNPLWQGDWEALACQNSELLRVFSQRVLRFYDIQDHADDRKKPLRLTFINRTGKRRLINQDKYIERAKSEFPGVTVQVAEFENTPFKKQLKVIRDTDILMGVHGAGLTHGLFLRSGSAMVEIMPPGLDHKWFRNLAKRMGHFYFRSHGAELESNEGRGWQHDDVYLEESRFVGLIRGAVASMDHRGNLDQDVD